MDLVNNSLYRRGIICWQSCVLARQQVREMAHMALTCGSKPRRGWGGFAVLASALALLAMASCATPGVDTAPIAGGSGMPQIALQAPIGLPAAQTARLGDQLISALQGRGVSMAPNPQSPAVFKLQGFCSAAGNGRETSIACVWDANTADGARAHRIISEENVAGNAPDNPWSVVSNATLDQIAASVGDKIAAWLPRSPTVASRGRSSLTTLADLGLSSNSRPPIAVRGVRGAPGDGNGSLAGAMASALRSQNIPVTRTSTRAFVLDGSVAMADSGRQKQSVTIEWTLTDPQGNARGTITQRNEIPRGALNGAWGGTAIASTAAAAKRIVGLLPATR